VFTNPILIVEDFEDDALILEIAFRRAGIRNTRIVVRDGEHAISYLQGTGIYANRDKYPLPRILVLDLKLPLVNGFQVLQWCRSQAPYRELFITLYTPVDNTRKIREAFLLGANTFLPKPPSQPDLQNSSEHTLTSGKLTILARFEVSTPLV